MINKKTQFLYTISWMFNIIMIQGATNQTWEIKQPLLPSYDDSNQKISDLSTPSESSMYIDDNMLINNKKFIKNLLNIMYACHHFSLINVEDFTNKILRITHALINLVCKLNNNEDNNHLNNLDKVINNFFLLDRFISTLIQVNTYIFRKKYKLYYANNSCVRKFFSCLLSSDSQKQNNHIDDLLEYNNNIKPETAFSDILEESKDKDLLEKRKFQAFLLNPSIITNNPISFENFINKLSLLSYMAFYNNDDNSWCIYFDQQVSYHVGREHLVMIRPHTNEQECTFRYIYNNRFEYRVCTSSHYKEYIKENLIKDFKNIQNSLS